MAGISSRAIGKLQNKHGFNGNELQHKEFSDGNGLDAYDFNFRTYDPQIGRFLQKDPLTAFAADHSPYSFVQNNPILFMDPQGLDTVRVNGEGSHRIKIAKGDVLAWTIGKNTSYYTYTPDNKDAVGGFVGGGMDEGTMDPVTVTPKSNSSNTGTNIGGLNFPTRDQSMWGVDAGLALAETSRSSFRITNGTYNGNAFSPRLYQSGWGGGSRAGIKTFSVGKTAGLASKGLFVVGVAFDGYGVYKYYQSGATNPDAVHPGKAGLNIGMGVYSLSVNPLAGALYFGVDAFYPGGWSGYVQDYDRLQLANQQILGPRFVLAPYGALKQ